MEPADNSPKPAKKLSIGDKTLLGLLATAGLGVLSLMGLSAKDQFAPTHPVEARVISVDRTTCGSIKYRESCAWVQTDKGTFLDSSMLLRGKFSSVVDSTGLQPGSSYKMNIVGPGTLTSDERLLSAEQIKPKPGPSK